MKKVVLSVALGLGLVSVAFALPDFSGYWVLNPSKGNYDLVPWGKPGVGPAPAGWKKGDPPNVKDEMQIKMTGTEMTINHVTGSGRDPLKEMKYILDGAAHTVKTPIGNVTCKASWDGSTLIITNPKVAATGPNSVIVLPEAFIERRLSLSADKKTLTVVVTIHDYDGQDGPIVEVYEKR